MSSKSESLYHDLSKRALMVFIGLAIYRLGAHITIPGINVLALKSSFEAGNVGLLGLFNMFSGGALSRLSLFSLGLMPYITSSIIIQLVTYSVPYLSELSKEGSSGRRKISQYTRYASIGLSMIQSIGIVKLSLMQGLVIIPPMLFTFTTMITLSTGTMVSLWIGEQMSEKGIGNGISLLIFAGIACRIPPTTFELIGMLRDNSITVVTALITVVTVMLMLVFVIFFERSLRQIPVQHARHHMQARMSGHKPTILPLKLNLAGVLPTIFASSLILFPSTIMNMIGNNGEIQQNINSVLMLMYPGKALYYISFIACIFFFSYFYTGLTFNPKEISDNLKRSGGVIPGMRPGPQTETYISSVVDRLAGIGAVYLCLVTLVPDLMRVFWHVPFSFGGTTMLISVVVMMDMIAQVQTYLVPIKYRKMTRSPGRNISLLKS